MNTTHDVTKNRHRKMLGFGVFQLIIPTVFILASWPLSSAIFGSPFAFEKTFLGADLLLLSATLCITIAVDLFCEVRHLGQFEKDIAIDATVLLSLGLGMITLFGFGVIKAKSFSFDFPSANNQGGQLPLLPAEIENCVNLCLSAGILGLLACTFFFFKSSTILLRAEQRRLEGEITSPTATP